MENEMALEMLDEYRGIYLMSYTYPDGRTAFRVFKGKSLLLMTMDYREAQDVFGDAINEAGLSERGEK